MTITGIVYERKEQVLADVEVTEVGEYKKVSVKVNDVEVIRFPLPAAADTNEIALRTGNVVNQTGLVENPVRVEITETP